MIDGKYKKPQRTGRQPLIPAELQSRHKRIQVDIFFQAHEIIAAEKSIEPTESTDVMDASGSDIYDGELSSAQTVTERRQEYIDSLPHSRHKENISDLPEQLKKFETEKLYYPWAKETMGRVWSGEMTKADILKEYALEEKDYTLMHCYLAARKQDDTTQAMDGPFVRPSAAEAVFRRIYPDLTDIF